MTSELFQVVDLLVDGFLGNLNLRIDELAVGNVNERTNVYDGCRNQRQSPDRKEFDEPVRDESSGECLGNRACILERAKDIGFPRWRRDPYRHRMGDILGKQNALEFDEKEISQLLDILQNGFNGFLGDRVVLARTEGG